MRYPDFWKKIVNILGLAAGVLTLIIAVLSIYEAISRYVFKSPNSWTLSLSCYALVFIVFFASPYAFQEGGHVAVDMVKIGCDKIDASGKLRRVIATIGFLCALVFMFVLGRGTWTLLKQAISSGKKTLNIPVIPLSALYAPMLIGLILMAITLLFIILDCIAKDGTGRYL